MKTLSRSQVLLLHSQLIDRYGGIHGVRDEGTIVTEEEFRKAEQAVQINCKGGGRKRKLTTQNKNEEKRGMIR